MGKLSFISRVTAAREKTRHIVSLAATRAAPVTFPCNVNVRQKKRNYLASRVSPALFADINR